MLPLCVVVVWCLSNCTPDDSEPPPGGQEAGAPDSEGGTQAGSGAGSGASDSGGSHSGASGGSGSGASGAMGGSHSGANGGADNGVAGAASGGEDQGAQAGTANGGKGGSEGSEPTDGGRTGLGEGGASAGADGLGEGGASAQCAGPAGSGATPITVKGDGVWAAWQDGDGPWVALAKTGSKFTFRPSGARYGVAVVCPASDFTTGYVAYDTTATQELTLCNSGGGVGTCELSFQGELKGTVFNVGASGWLLTDDDGTAIGLPIAPTAGQAPYSVLLGDGRNVVFGIALASGQPLTKVAVKRDAIDKDTVSPATLNVDFNSDAKPTTLKNVTIGGLQAGDTQTHQVRWNLANDDLTYCAWGGLRVSTDSGDATDTYAALDASQVDAADSYSASVSANKNGDAKNYAGVATANFKTPVDLTLPVAFADASVALLASSPHSRLRASFAPYPHATSYGVRASCPVSGGSARRWSLSATPAWLGSCSSCQVSMPDLGETGCFDESRACPAGSTVTVDVTASGGDASTTPPLSWYGVHDGLTAAP
ncbi:MAG TPA: hypothetical protein VEQ58_01410 [Polyangiaceae bacterium]|nr:hypothetical protein [Polyangiaceae bacterium]